MDTDNAFETLIELLSTPVMILLDEQENGGKVSNLLDNNEIPSIGSNKEVTNSNLPILGIGGISNWHDAAEYITLGADVVQVRTEVMVNGSG